MAAYCWWDSGASCKLHKSQKRWRILSQKKNDTTVPFSPFLLFSCHIVASPHFILLPWIPDFQICPWTSQWPGTSYFQDGFSISAEKEERGGVNFGETTIWYWFTSQLQQLIIKYIFMTINHGTNNWMCVYSWHFMKIKFFFLESLLYSQKVMSLFSIFYFYFFSQNITIFFLKHNFILEI